MTTEAWAAHIADAQTLLGIARASRRTVRRKLVGKTRRPASRGGMKILRRSWDEVHAREQVCADERLRNLGIQVLQNRKRLRGSAEVLQGGCEIGASHRERWLDVDGASVEPDRLVELPLSMPDQRKIRQGDRERRLISDRELECLCSRCELMALKQCKADVEMSLCQARIELKRPLKILDRGFGLAQVPARQAAGAQRICKIRLCCDRLVQQRQRSRMIASFVGDQARDIQGHGVARIHRQDMPADRIGSACVAGSQKTERASQQVRIGGCHGSVCAGVSAGRGRPERSDSAIGIDLTGESMYSFWGDSSADPTNIRGPIKP